MTERGANYPIEIIYPSTSFYLCDVVCVLVLFKHFFILYCCVCDILITDVEEKVQNIPTPFKKLVFVLIDAMKYDFVYKTYHRQSMPYLSKLFNDGRVQLYKSLAKAPTVTLPRLKVVKIRQFMFYKM